MAFRILQHSSIRKTTINKRNFSGNSLKLESVSAVTATIFKSRSEVEKFTTLNKENKNFKCNRERHIYSFNISVASQFSIVYGPSF